MNESIKSYYLTAKGSDYSIRRPSRVVLWHKNYYIEVEEDVEYKQDLEIYVGRFPEEVVGKPKSDQWEIVKPILNELFFDHYLIALKRLNKIDLSEGEFYLISHNKDWFQVEYFSVDRKPGNHISIDFRDSIDSLWLMVRGSSSQRSRSRARKDGVPMTVTHFKQIFDLTLKYLSDSYSLKILLLNYIKSFKSLCEGEIDYELFKISDEKIFEKVVDKLKVRKRNIEERLIQNDKDSESERIKLRGEIDGINYALETIKTV